MRTLNVRLAAILLVFGVVFCVGVYYLHGYQVQRNAYVFKREAERAQARAEEAAKEKDVGLERSATRDRITNLGWYVRLVPDELDVVEELGLLLADTAQDSRTYSQAFSTLERVLRQDPSRKNVRRRLVDMAMMGRRYQDAKEHLEQFLLKQSPEDAELWELLGQCHAEIGEYELAIEKFKRAIEIDPNRVQVYPRLATLLRYHFSRPKEADELMKKMVKINPKSAQAHFLRGSYLKGLELDDQAMEEALQSLELEPDNRDGLWLASQCCLTKKEYGKARDYANRSIKLYPNNITMYTTLADVELRAGDRGKAVAALQDGLKATARNPQLLWSLANVLIDVGQPKDADKTIEELRKTEYPKALIEYLVARNDFAQSHWLAARQGFEKVRGTLLQWPNLLKQVDVWIGQCYGQLGNRDLQLVAYRRALSTDQFYTPARAGLMDVLMATGDVETALQEYQQLAKLGKLGGASLIPYAKMLVVHTMRQPTAKQDWKPVLKVLDEAERINPNDVQIPVIRSEILVAQNRYADAEALLEKARKENPGQAGLWSVQANLAERQKDWDKSEQLLEQAQKQWGDTVANRLALAQLLAKRHGKKATDRLRKMADNADRFTDADRLQLWAGLANAAMQVGDAEFATQLCQRIAEKEPHNVQVRFMLFEQALRAEDDSGMERALKEVERVAGQGAFWLYGQAVRLSIQAKDKKGDDQDQLLNRALELLVRARESRQSWSRIPLLTAGIYDQQGKVDVALKNYLEAIDMGEHDPNAVQRAVQLLFQKQRFADADRLLHQLDEQKVPFSNDMNRFGAEAALRGGDFDRALALARKAAAADSKRYQDHLWLGQMLTVIGRKAKSENDAKKATELFAEAEKALRRAVQVEPKLPATWVALIQFLSSTEKEDHAERMIDEASKNIPAKQASLAIAQCYEVMNKTEAAEQKYEAALAASPEDPLVLRSVADFYCRVGKLVPAEAILRRLVDGKVKVSDADLTWARRQLALVFSSRGGYRNLQKARELIEQNMAAGEVSVLDRRVKAGLDASDPDRSRRDDAIRTLETLLQDQSATPDDRLQLAQMYRAAGAWQQASTLFRKLITISGNEPRYLSIYITALLEHDETVNAEAYLERLESASPNHSATVGLRAEVLVAKGEPDKAIELLDGFIDKQGARPPERNTRVRLVAEKLEQLSKKLTKPEQKALRNRFVQRAEALYRTFLEKNPREEPRPGFAARGLLRTQRANGRRARPAATNVGHWQPRHSLPGVLGPAPRRQGRKGTKAAFGRHSAEGVETVRTAHSLAGDQCRVVLQAGALRRRRSSLPRDSPEEPRQRQCPEQPRHPAGAPRHQARRSVQAHWPGDRGCRARGSDARLAGEHLPGPGRSR
jgi:cellulose synthase operon protein C